MKSHQIALARVSDEFDALHDEVTYWRRRAERAETASRRLDRPLLAHFPAGVDVEIRHEERWYRIYINGVYIDGYEDEATANSILGRLHKAFPKPKTENLLP